MPHRKNEHKSDPNAKGGPLLFLDELEIVSVLGDRLTVRHRKPVKVNIPYRLKCHGGKDAPTILCSASHCVVRLVLDDEGQQIPIYEATFEPIPCEGSLSLDMVTFIQCL